VPQKKEINKWQKNTKNKLAPNETFKHELM
jgi:hypothetical protein